MNKITKIAKAIVLLAALAASVAATAQTASAGGYAWSGNVGGHKIRPAGYSWNG